MASNSICSSIRHLVAMPEYSAHTKTILASTSIRTGLNMKFTQFRLTSRGNCWNCRYWSILQFCLQQSSWSIAHKNRVRWRDNPGEKQRWHSNMGWRHTGKFDSVNLWNIEASMACSLFWFRDNVCWQCRARTRLRAGMWSDCKEPYWLLLFSQFIWIRSCWEVFCIQRTCTGKNLIEIPYIHLIAHAHATPSIHFRISAVCGRIEAAIQGLPPPYCLNKPKFALVTSTETRNQIKAPNFGINWSISQKSVEVVNSLTGKTINNKISRLSKQTFFMRYAALIKQLPNLSIARTITGDYSETKRSVRDYQMAKRELFEAFRREDLGNWLKKPMEQDEFHLPKWRDLDADGGIEPIDFSGSLISTTPNNCINKRLVCDTSNGKTDIKPYGLKLRKSLSINTINNKQKRHHDKTLNRIAEQYNSGPIGRNQKFGFVTFKE